MNFKKIVSFLGMILILVSSFVAKEKYMVGDLKPGQYKVGFKVYHEKDYSRNYSTSIDNENRPVREFKPMPMQIGVWYPAESVSGHPLKFGDYVNLGTTRDGIEYHNDSKAKQVSDSVYYRRSFVGTIDTAKLKSFLEIVTTAHEDAKPKSGKYPVIISNSFVSDGLHNNSVLNEYLASYGYIVIASAPKLNPTNYTFFVHATEDLKYLKGFAHKLENTDMTNVGLVGYQNIALLGLSQTDQSIKAVVDLTASAAGSGNFINGLRTSYQYLDGRALRTPILMIDGTTYALQKTNIKTELDKMLYTDVYYINYEKAIPLSFSSEWLFRWVKGLDNPNQGFFLEKDMSEKAYVGTVKNTKIFFDAYLKGNNHAMANLKGLKSSDKNYTVLARSANPVPPSSQQFTNILRDVITNNKSLEPVVKTWRDVKKIDPGYNILNASFPLNTGGYQMINRGRTAEAVTLFEMMLEDFPNDPNLWDSAGEGYLANGQKEKAVEALKKSLSWNPPAPQGTRDNSSALLRELGYFVDNKGNIIEGKSALVDIDTLNQQMGSRNAPEGTYPGVQPFDDPGRVSPNREIETSLGSLKIKIEYGAPYVRNRQVVGGLVSTYRPWRTGANEATVITFSSDVKFEGQKIPAGSYALFSIGGENEWTWVLNSQFQQWGAFNYNANFDVMRCKVKSKKTHHQEEMKFEFENVSNNSATAVLKWGEYSVPFKIEKI